MCEIAIARNQLKGKEKVNIKMIVTDLDKTLLRSDKTISDYTAKTFHLCQQLGIIVVFATARSESSCKRFIKLINPDAIISNGGAIVRIGRNVIYHATMNVKIANELLRLCLEHPKVGYVTVDTEKGYFVNKLIGKHVPSWDEYVSASQKDLSKGLECDAYKITAEIFDDSTAYSIASTFPTIDVLKFSGERWFRFANTYANKWEGLKSLAAYANVDLREIVAFGDDHNDVAMVSKCGTGVAVDNAIAEVKDVADYVCDTNDSDGVARWLEENIQRLAL